jgi:hypothetical protein
LSLGAFLFSCFFGAGRLSRSVRALKGFSFTQLRALTPNASQGNLPEEATMSRRRTDQSTGSFNLTFRRWAAPALVLAMGFTLAAGPAVAKQPSNPDSVYESGLFELGDGNPPPGFPGVADILPDEAQLGPDWAALFAADGSALDADGNGMPDYLDLGGNWAFFAADDVSLGSGFESTAAAPGGGIVNGVAAADHDLGNAYVFSTFNSLGNLILYAAAERLGGGDSVLEFEFNQDYFRLGHGGYGRNEPWEIVGDRLEGDVLVKLTFAAGALANADVNVWNGADWLALSAISGESCNSGETFCALRNGAEIDGGPWANYDTAGADPEVIGLGRFVEMGLNIGALLGAQPQFTTVQLRTPEDAAFGLFAEGN